MTRDEMNKRINWEDHMDLMMENAALQKTVDLLQASLIEPRTKKKLRGGRMNREEIIRMAREAGFEFPADYDLTEPTSRLERFAALIEAATKERCAQVCEAEAEKWEGDDGPICHEARLCAVNIRSME